MLVYSSVDIEHEKAAWYHSQGLTATPRLESYSTHQLTVFVKESLSKAPTIVSSLFGDVKLIRQLPVPFHKFNITHDGIVYCPALLTLRQGQPNYDAFVRSYNLISPRADSEFEMVRLVNAYGNVRCFMIHRLIAAVFLPNPRHYPHVYHINDITTDNHVQNLQLTSNWSSTVY